MNLLTIHSVKLPKSFIAINLSDKNAAGEGIDETDASTPQEKV